MLRKEQKFCARNGKKFFPLAERAKIAFSARRARQKILLRALKDTPNTHFSTSALLCTTKTVLVLLGLDKSCPRPLSLTK